MKITAVDAYPVSMAVRPEVSIVSAAGEHRVSHYVIVAVHTDEGRTGFGEANVAPVWSGETQQSALFAIREVLAPVLVGRDPLDSGAISDAMDRALFGNPFTKAAMEMAMLDAAGKFLRVPVCTLLGGKRRAPEIPLKFSIGAFPPAQAGRVAEQAIARGLRAVKVKVGLGVNGDIARIQAVRSAVGENVRVGVDANGGWNENEASTAIPHLEKLGINMIEQPLRRGDFRGCARLRQRTSIPILLDESIFTREQALQAIRTDACDMVSIYPGKNGGLRRSVEIAQLAAAAGLECVIGSNLEWELGSAAMLHVAVAIPNLASSVNHDIIGPLYNVRQVGAEAIRIENGCAVLPDGDGLGISVDLAAMEAGA